MKTLTYHSIAGVSLAIFLTALPAEARKIKTKHSIPKGASELSDEDAKREGLNVISLSSDSIDFCNRIIPGIRFYGFDKTVGSSIESFFIVNGLDSPLAGMEIEITYVDMKGRQLHKRSVTVDCDIPAGETKRVDTKSWDTQKSFYFHQSVKPKRQATPFDIRLRLLSVSTK